MFRFCGISGKDLNVDIVPLFETIEGLDSASDSMDKLYRMPHYEQHLHHRLHFQTIMLGFSDGTKDGGYIKANWEIYKAKEKLTAISAQHGVNVIFFDGRGGHLHVGVEKHISFMHRKGLPSQTMRFRLRFRGKPSHRCMVRCRKRFSTLSNYSLRGYQRCIYR